jgi:hypothetical protein
MSHSAAPPPDHVHFHGVPSLLLFPAIAGPGSGHAIEYDGDVGDPHAMYDWLVVHTSVKGLIPKLPDHVRFRWGVCCGS